jgi:hypothetical protein
LLRKVFGGNDLIATPKRTARQVDGRNGLDNVRLFLEIGEAFSVRFGASEITSLRTVG